MSRLVAPCFEFLADTLLFDLRDKAANEAIMEPFWNGVPDGFGGLNDWHQRQQRTLIVMAETERLLRDMSPHELQIRTLFKIADGPRPWSPYQGFRRRAPA